MQQMTGFLGKISELDAVKDAEIAWWQAQPISVRSTATFELVRVHHLLLENIYRASLFNRIVR